MTITVQMPVALEQTMPPARARLHFAIGAFVSEEVTLGQAAEMAGISQTELISVLAKRRIPLHYDSVYSDGIRLTVGVVRAGSIF